MDVWIWILEVLFSSSHIILLLLTFYCIIWFLNSHFVYNPIVCRISFAFLFVFLHFSWKYLDEKNLELEIGIPSNYLLMSSATHTNWKSNTLYIFPRTEIVQFGIFTPQCTRMRYFHQIFFISYPCAISTVLNPRDLAKKQ